MQFVSSLVRVCVGGRGMYTLSRWLLGEDQVVQVDIPEIHVDRDLCVLRRHKTQRGLVCIPCARAYTVGYTCTQCC